MLVFKAELMPNICPAHKYCRSIVTEALSTRNGNGVQGQVRSDVYSLYASYALLCYVLTATEVPMVEKQTLCTVAVCETDENSS